MDPWLLTVCDLRSTDILISIKAMRGTFLIPDQIKLKYITKVKECFLSVGRLLLL